MKKAECSNCGADAPVVVGSYRFEESGLDCVILAGIEIIKCAQCGNEDPIIPRLNALMRLLTLAVLKKPYRLCGQELRFLRKYVRMTGEQFATFLHVDKTTISKWENNEDPIGDQSDRLIRAVVLALGQGLRAKLEEAIRAFPDIQNTPRRLCIEMDPRNMIYRYSKVA